MTTRTSAKDRVARAFASDLQIRGDGRTIIGLAVPFSTPTEIRDQLGTYQEQILRGAFKRTIAERGPGRVKFLVSHDHAALPIGRTVSLKEEPQGLVAEFRVAQTPRGDEALQLVKEGALDGLSIGFRSVRDSWSSDGSQRTILEAALLEVSLVSIPAYSDAVVTAVRAQTTPLLLAAQQELLRRKEMPTP